MKARSIGRRDGGISNYTTSGGSEGSERASERARVEIGNIFGIRKREGDTCAAAVRWSRSTPIMAPFGSSICIEWDGMGEARSTRSKLDVAEIESNDSN